MTVHVRELVVSCERGLKSVNWIPFLIEIVSIKVRVVLSAATHLVREVVTRFGVVSPFQNKSIRQSVGQLLGKSSGGRCSCWLWVWQSRFPTLSPSFIVFL